VRGISVSYGNTTVEHAHRNAVEIMRRLGRRMTIAVGARRPLERPIAVAAETHGPSGLGHAVVPPAGVILDWVKTLDQLLGAQEQPVTLLMLGPLTSLARALHVDAELVRSKVKRVLVMAGNLSAAGNTTPFSEFNAWCDPEALDIVLRAALPLDMVTLDATRQVVLRGPDIRRLGRAEHEQARWFFEALRFYLDFHKEYEGLDGCVINDVLAVASLIRPDVLSFQEQRLMVELETGDNRGRTRLDPGGHPVRVAVKPRSDPVMELLYERVIPWAHADSESAVPR
jgi:inosine-uridine nucleoside N-ribohydrolase